MFLFAMKQVMNIRQTNILYFLYELEIQSIKQLFGAINIITNTSIQLLIYRTQPMCIDHRMSILCIKKDQRNK